MSEFEIITITFSFIIGLGIAQLLSSFGAAVRERREHPLHWLPVAWAFVILLFSVQYWFALFDLDQEIGLWNWLWYGQLLFLAVALFLAGTLILPTREARVEGGLMADFSAHGRLALVALICYLIGWLPANARLNEGQLFTPANWWNVGLAAFAFVVFWSRSAKIQKVATVLFFGAFAYVLFFVYSIPGPERTP